MTVNSSFVSPSVIDNFSGEYYFLSNFYPVHIKDYIPPSFGGINSQKLSGPTSEHVFHAAKTFIPVKQQEVLNAETPGKAKMLGRKVLLRPDWEKIKNQIMYDILKIKFANGTELAQRLLDTYPCELVEGNVWNDIYWGVCNGKGKNHLGEILMEIREELLEEENNK